MVYLSDITKDNLLGFLCQLDTLLICKVHNQKIWDFRDPIPSPSQRRKHYIGHHFTTSPEPRVFRKPFAPAVSEDPLNLGAVTKILLALELILFQTRQLEDGWSITNTGALGVTNTYHDLIITDILSNVFDYWYWCS